MAYKIVCVKIILDVALFSHAKPQIVVNLINTKDKLMSLTQKLLYIFVYEAWEGLLVSALVLLDSEEDYR